MTIDVIYMVNTLSWNKLLSWVAYADQTIDLVLMIADRSSSTLYPVRRASQFLFFVQGRLFSVSLFISRTQRYCVTFSRITTCASAAAFSAAAFSAAISFAFASAAALASASAFAFASPAALACAATSQFQSQLTYSYLVYYVILRQHFPYNFGALLSSAIQVWIRN